MSQKYSAEDVNRWAELYFQDKLSLHMIQKIESVPFNSVCKCLRQAGYSMRPLSVARQLFLRRNNGLKKGRESAIWQGGEYRHQGYVFVYCPDHPRGIKANYEKRSILTWEKAHKRKLPKDWAVHHLNGIKDDDCPENLVAYPMLKHTMLIPHLLNRIKALELENTALREGQALMFRKEELSYA